MSQVPATVEAAVALAGPGLGTGWLNGEKEAEGIRLRRFAGPARHAELLSHLRVAHLTDLHVGRMTPMRVLERAVALTNAESPDLVCITGDFVCHSQRYLDELTTLVAGFGAPVVAVLGNHDHWCGADEVRRALRQAGAEVLDNRHTVLTIRHQRLQVLGLDDAYTGHADRRRAVRGLRSDLPTLALSHIAEEADGLWHDGAPLVLAGHTHAGQVTIAKLHEIALGRLVGHRYVHGLYGRRRPDATARGAVYVGAGLGAAVLPLRLGERAKREITLFDLGHDPGTFGEHHAEQEPQPGRPTPPRVYYRRATAVTRKEHRRRRRAEQGRRRG